MATEGETVPLRAAVRFDEAAERHAPGAESQGATVPMPLKQWKQTRGNHSQGRSFLQTNRGKTDIAMKIAAKEAKLREFSSEAQALLKRERIRKRRQADVAGGLTVTVEAIRNFRDAAGLFDRTDPFCELALGSEVFRTQTHDNAGGSVTFNETFTFTAEASAEQFLHIKVMDSDTLIDDTMGVHDLDLKQHSDGPLTVDLTRDGEIRGQVCLQLLRHDTNKRKGSARDFYGADFLALDDHFLASLRRAENPRDFVETIHRKNLSLQQMMPFYRILDKIRAADIWDEDFDGTGVDDELLQMIDRIKVQILETCTPEALLYPRPVGENPVHVAFLFGLHQFGREMIEKAAEFAARDGDDPEQVTRAFVQRPFVNDLQPWFSLASRAAKRRGSGHQDSSRSMDSTNSATNQQQREKEAEFSKLLHRHFPEEVDRREALLSYNLVDPDSCPDGGRDGGMFTGQTLLHIAILQHETDVVRWLVDNGARVDARAGGIFFQQPIADTFGWAAQAANRTKLNAITAIAGAVHVKRLQRESTAVFQEKTQRKKSETIKTYRELMAVAFDLGSQKEKLEVGGCCYYGEFPLSFAASVGDVHICHMLMIHARESILQGLTVLNHMEDVGGELNGQASQKQDAQALYATEFLAGLFSLLSKTKGELFEKNSSQQSKLLTLVGCFLNRSDAFGNTALHMAVMYKQSRVVDWLLDHGGKPSMRAMNEDGLTPLTLAVRNGDPDMFQHLISRMRVQTWEIGSSKMIATPLEQIDTFRITSSVASEGETMKRPSWFLPRRVADTFISARSMPTGQSMRTASADTEQSHDERADSPTHDDFASGKSRMHETFSGNSGMDPLASLDALSRPEVCERLMKINDDVQQMSLLALSPLGTDKIGKASSSLRMSWEERSAHLKVKNLIYKNEDKPLPTSLHEEPNWRSALEVVVQHEINEFFDEDIFVDLVDTKWEQFGRRKQLLRILICALVVLCASFAVDHRTRSMRNYVLVQFGATEEYIHPPEFQCFFLIGECPQEWEYALGVIFDLLLYGVSVLYFLYLSWRCARFSVRDLDPDGNLDIDYDEMLLFFYKNLTTFLGILSSCFILNAFWMRGIGSGWTWSMKIFSSLEKLPHLPQRDQDTGHRAVWTELHSLSIAIVLMWCNLLHLLLPFQTIGRVLITFWRMLISDVFKWVIVYFFLLVGFSQAVIIALQDLAMQVPAVAEGLANDVNGQGLNLTAPLSNLDFMKYYLLVTMGEVEQPAIKSAGNYENQTIGSFVWMLHFIFLMVSTLLLFNLIIAMMGETYHREKTNAGAAMWWMIRAMQVLDWEKQLTKDQKLLYRTGVPDPRYGGHRETPYYTLQEVVVEESQDDRAFDGHHKVRTLDDLKNHVDKRLRTLRKALYPDEEDDDIIETVTKAIGGSHKHHTKSRATGHSRFLHAGKKVKTVAKMKAAMRPQPKEEEDTDDDEAATKRELKSTRMMRFRKAGAKAKLISKLQTSGALHWASDERAQQLRRQQHHDERSRLDKVESKIDLLLDRIGVKGSKSTDE